MILDKFSKFWTKEIEKHHTVETEQWKSSRVILKGITNYMENAEIQEELEELVI